MKKQRHPCATQYMGCRGHTPACNSVPPGDLLGLSEARSTNGTTPLLLVLSAQCPVPSAQCSVLSAQCSVLSAQCSVLTLKKDSAAPRARSFSSAVTSPGEGKRVARHAHKNQYETRKSGGCAVRSVRGPHTLNAGRTACPSLARGHTQVVHMLW